MRLGRGSRIEQANNRNPQKYIVFKHMAAINSQQNKWSAAFQGMHLSNAQAKLRTYTSGKEEMRMVKSIAS